VINDESIKDLFSRYTSTLNNALFGDTFNGEVFQKSFAAYVVGANPVGVGGGSNDKRFQDVIHHGIDFYRKIGITSMNISSIEITMLDNFHACCSIR